MNLEELKVELHNKQLTLLPLKTLSNIESLLIDCVENEIEGDFVETGVWRGGACILAFHVLKNLKSKKKVWLFDSFEGLPKPNVEKFPLDEGDPHWTISELRVDLEQVKNNFMIFGEIQEDNPVFIKGWFSDTMPNNSVEKIAVLRLDGDMYESTIVVLENLYKKLSIGGYCIIDDFGHHRAKQAVLDFREKYAIDEEIVLIDQTPNVYPSVYWKKNKDVL